MPSKAEKYSRLAYLLFLDIEYAQAKNNEECTITEIRELKNIIQDFFDRFDKHRDAEESLLNRKTSCRN
jgi:hypothetical protein